MASIFKNRYGEPRSGWPIAAGLILILIAQMASYSFASDGREDDIFLKIIVTLVYGILAVGGILLLFKLFYSRPLRQMGIIKEGFFIELLHGFAIGAISTALIFFVLIFSGEAQVLSMNQSRLFSTGIVIELASVFTFVVSEELFARGLLMTALKTTRNKWVIILSSSLLFGLLHMINPGATILSITNMCLGGLLLAYMFVKSGKLWLPIGYHIAVNFMTGDIFGMTVGAHTPQTTVFDTIIIGSNTLLSGGSIGPEGGLLLTGSIMLGLLYVRFVVKTPSGTVWTMSSDLPLMRGGKGK